MATITTKYSIGDVVYFAGTVTAAKQHPCPDCKGEKKWKAVSPAGNEYDFACPRCTARYLSNHNLSLNYTAHVPRIRRLTIGSVQFNSNPGSYDPGARYMCQETGIGSGSVYDEAKLFETEAGASVAAQAMANLANLTPGSFLDTFNTSLEISDYQLENAALKNAKAEASRASSMIWNLSDLFDKIENSGDREEILEAVADYKRFDWSRDKEASTATQKEAAA